MGFKSVYMTGSGTSAEHGFSDVGLLTQTKMVTNARYIANAVDVPLVADCDTGYGNRVRRFREVADGQPLRKSHLQVP